MSETAKVRLVRCPQCENLLPEVTDYSVYQCGGCGAVLRAKNKGAELDTFSEKSVEERIGGTLEKFSDRYEKMMNVSDRRMMDMSDGSESDVRSSISSSSRAERRRILRDRAEISRASLASKEEKWDVEGDAIQDKKSDELQRAEATQEFENLVIYHDNEDGLRRSDRVVGGRNRERSEMEDFWRAQRMDAGDSRHTKGGPSSFLSRSSYDYENPATNVSDVDGFGNGEYVGDDRAELLRKLNELTDQLSRSGNLIDKGKEKIPLDTKIPPEDPHAYESWYSDASLDTNRATVQDSYPDAQFRRPPYQNQYAEPPPLMQRQDMVGNGLYPPRFAPTHVQGYGDPSRSHMLRRGPPLAPAPYHILPSHAYMSGPYMDDGVVYMDTMEQHPPHLSRHHPSCSCYQCRAKRQVSTPILPTAYGEKYFHVPNDMISNYHDHPGAFGSRDYNRRVSDPHPARSHIAQTHLRWSSDVNSKVDGFIRRRPPRVHLTSSGTHCRPIAGGAPFLTCYNCFELLLLPKKVLTKNNNRKKLRCGACSTVIAFTVSQKNLVVLFDVEANDDHVKVDNKRDVLSRHGYGHMNQARTTFSSDDYDNPGYDFQSMDRELGQISTRPGRANKSTDVKPRHSTSTYTSEADEDMESLTAVRKDSSLADLSTEDKGPPPPEGSTLQDYFEYSNKYHAVRDSGEGNRSGHSDHDKVLPNKTTNRQILRKESTATEIDLSCSEYSNTGTTFDSSEVSRGESGGDHLKVSRGAESFFAGIMKKSFKDSHRSKETFEQENANVTVNGHLISDRLIKKAEKLAGPIQPGHYWYDFRAGFWGAIGGPCLGIIPPFIEEFNYSMPEHCAGGNTQVFVNGRELNQKDLNLLVSRGLPTERDRSYIIEISGRVLDEDTGEELESLGKLAPTIERMKRGFGMRPSKAAA